MWNAYGAGTGAGLVVRHEARLPYLYIERATISVKSGSVVSTQEEVSSTLPIATISTLMLGPGTTISHEAVKKCSENDCLLQWVGEEGVRSYSTGIPLHPYPKRLVMQCICAHDERRKGRVARCMYEKRFGSTVDPSVEIPTLRGMEGVRVREIYKVLAARHKVSWEGRVNSGIAWEHIDPINRAISAASYCLVSSSIVAVLSAGYSPGVGFIHEGYDRAFAHDIADIFKYDTAVPLAFEVVAAGDFNIEQRVRWAMRDLIRKGRLVDSMIQASIEVVDAGANPSKSSRKT